VTDIDPRVHRLADRIVRELVQTTRHPLTLGARKECVDRIAEAAQRAIDIERAAILEELRGVS
jgi:hypothetical protein